MRKLALTVAIATSSLLFTTTSWSAFRSPSIGGATGLITTPTARTAWESSTFGFDTGYHYVSDQGGTHIPKATLSLFNRWEIGGAFDTNGDRADNEDILLHSKFRFSPWSGSSNSALAIGGNFQSLEGPSVTNGQVYLAATYGGSFFNMPAETTFVFG